MPKERLNSAGSRILVTHGTSAENSAYASLIDRLHLRWYVWAPIIGIGLLATLAVLTK